MEQRSSVELDEAQTAAPSTTGALISFFGGLRDYIATGMWGAALFLFAATFIFQNFKIPTQSMENTLLIGDHLTANKFVFRRDIGLAPAREPRRGEVVIFKWPGDVRQIWIKRLIGLPGDHFELVNDQVLIDGQPLDETYAFFRSREPWRSQRDPLLAYRPADYYQLKPGLAHAQDRPHENVTLQALLDNTERLLKDEYAGRDPKAYRRLVERLRSSDGRTIPPDFYLVMGDNRNQSFDSRGWGLLPRELLQGRAYWVWWSYGEDENTQLLEGWELVKIYLRYPLTFWSRTHWEQCFRRIR